MTLGLLDSMTATQEFVVPRSMPTTLHKKESFSRQFTSTSKLRGGAAMRVLAPAREHAQQDSKFYLRGEGAGVRLQE